MIQTEEENERVLAIVERLMAKETTYPIGQAAPAEMIAFLLEQRGLKPVALAEILGSRGRVSEILAAKRSVSKEQAKRLAEFFRVSAATFI